MTRTRAVLLFSIYLSACTGVASDGSLGVERGSDALRADGTRDLRYLDSQKVIAIDSSATGGNYAYAPEILLIDGTYHLWACDGNDHGGDAIRYTTSTDGRTWSTPTIVFDLANSIPGIASHACDPSVVRFTPPGASSAYFYLYFTTTPDLEGGANGVARTSANAPGGPYELYLGGDPAAPASWSARRDVIPGFVTTPRVNCAGRSGCYGAGQPSLVWRDGVLHMWYTDTTAGANNAGGIYHATSTDGVRFTPGVATTLTNHSTVSVKFDPAANKYILFALSNHQASGPMTASWSDDGVTFTSPEALPGAVPRFSHNLGVSSDPSGYLDFSRPVLVGMGAPWDERSDYTNDACTGPNNGACWGYWDLFVAPLYEGSTPPPDIRAQGFFSNGGTIFYSNGVDAFCGFETPSHLLACAGGVAPPVSSAASLPADMRNDGSCACGREAPPAPVSVQPYGLFVVGGTVYFSNGADAICGLTSPEHLASCFPTLMVGPTLGARPTSMRDDGPCACGTLAPPPSAPPPSAPPPSAPPPSAPPPSAPPSGIEPEGFFVNGGTVYYSNGANAFCGFASPAHLLGCNAGASPRSSPLPSGMANHGTCECGATLVQPGGFFQNGSTVYYSNGADAFCGISSPEQLNRCSGGNPGSLPTTPTLPLRMRNDGVCGC